MRLVAESVADVMDQARTGAEDSGQIDLHRDGTKPEAGHDMGNHDAGHEPEAGMYLVHLSDICDEAQKIMKTLQADPDAGLPAWVQDKLTLSRHNLEAVADYLCRPQEAGQADDMEAIDEKKKDGDPCWKGYEQIGTKQKNGKEVPNCVPTGK